MQVLSGPEDIDITGHLIGRTPSLDFKVADRFGRESWFRGCKVIRGYNKHEHGTKMELALLAEYDGGETTPMKISIDYNFGTRTGILTGIRINE